LSSDTVGKVYRGNWLIGDPLGNILTVPYDVRKVIWDGFSAFPPERVYWHIYRGTDTMAYIKPSSPILGFTTLEFVFDTVDVNSAVTTGMYSNYALSGDFLAQDESMIDFSWSFIVSTGTDTSQYMTEDGETGYAGFVFSRKQAEDKTNPDLLAEYGVFDSLHTGFSLAALNPWAGIVRLDRVSDTLTFMYLPEYLVGYDEFDTLDVSYAHFPSDSLRVHVRMSAWGSGDTRRCQLVQYNVERGVVTPTQPEG
jgi:hypothetical protein